MNWYSNKLIKNYEDTPRIIWAQNNSPWYQKKHQESGSEHSYTNIEHFEEMFRVIFPIYNGGPWPQDTSEIYYIPKTLTYNKFEQRDQSSRESGIIWYARLAFVSNNKMYALDVRAYSLPGDLQTKGLSGTVSILYDNATKEKFSPPNGIPIGNIRGQDPKDAADQLIRLIRGDHHNDDGDDFTEQQPPDPAPSGRELVPVRVPSQRRILNQAAGDVNQAWSSVSWYNKLSQEGKTWEYQHPDWVKNIEKNPPGTSYFSYGHDWNDRGINEHKPQNPNDALWTCREGQLLVMTAGEWAEKGGTSDSFTHFQVFGVLQPEQISGRYDAGKDILSATTRGRGTISSFLRRLLYQKFGTIKIVEF